MIYPNFGPESMVHKMIHIGLYEKKLGKGNITIELLDDHKVEVHLEDELSDPIQPPFEVPDPPGSGIVSLFQQFNYC